VSVEIYLLFIYIYLRYLCGLMYDWVYVRSTARPIIHLQLDISANALETRAVQSPK
jgi:hypothetical protein